MTHAPRHSSETLDQLAKLLIAHAELVNDTSEGMALDIAASLEALQVEIKDARTSGPVQKNLTKMLAALQNQDKLRQQMLVVIRGLELVSDVKLPDTVVAQDWYANRLEEIQKRYVMREQVQVHERFMGKTTDDGTGADEIEFF